MSILGVLDSLGVDGCGVGVILFSFEWFEIGNNLCDAKQDKAGSERMLETH
jgi:hypothetical protein